MVDMFGGLSGLVGGALKMLANEQSNEYQAQAAQQQQQWSQMSQNQAQDFNAIQASLGRDFSSRQQDQVLAFNQAEADVARQFSAGQQSQAEAYNAEQAALNRQFQERMSSTAYQRSRQDMVAAGLNPILAAGAGGASTPTGAMGSIGAVGGSQASAGSLGGPSASISAVPGARMSDRVGLLEGVISSAGEAARLKPQVDVLKAEYDVKSAQEHNVQAQTQATNALTSKTLQETETERWRAAQVKADTERSRQESIARATEPSKFSIHGPFGSGVSGTGSSIKNIPGAIAEGVSSAKQWWNMLGE